MGAKVEHSTFTPLSFDQNVYRSGYAASGQNEYWNSASCYAASVSKLSDEPIGAPIVVTGTVTSNFGGSALDYPSWGGYPSCAQIQTSSGWPNNAIVAGGGSSAGFPSPNRGSFIPKQDDLASSIDKLAGNFDELLSKIKCHRNQVGLGLITDKGCETVELFDLNKSWKVLHKDAVKRLGDKTAEKDTSGVFQYRPDKAIAAVREVLNFSYQEKVLFEHRAKDGHPQVTITALSHDKFTGEVVELDGRVIHLVLLKMTN